MRGTQEEWTAKRHCDWGDCFKCHKQRDECPDMRRLLSWLEQRFGSKHWVETRTFTLASQWEQHWRGTPAFQPKTKLRARLMSRETADCAQWVVMEREKRPVLEMVEAYCLHHDY